MDFTLYWFMFPVATLIATVAMLSGIAGTALFMPFFLLALPLLGPEYVLSHPVQAIVASLITSSFGFASGLIAYLRLQLIRFKISKAFIVYSIPGAILGAGLCPLLPAFVLRLIYGLFTLVLALWILKQTQKTLGLFQFFKRPSLNQTLPFYRSSKPNPYLTSFGGFLTGLLSVGIGETTMSQLIRIKDLPYPHAAASSVVVVIVTMLTAAVVQVMQLSLSRGMDGVPWHLLIYTVPGVLIGGQLGPRLQGQFSDQRMKRLIAYLFIAIAIMMFFTIV